MPAAKAKLDIKNQQPRTLANLRFTNRELVTHPAKEANEKADQFRVARANKFKPLSSILELRKVTRILTCAATVEYHDNITQKQFDQALCEIVFTCFQKAHCSIYQFVPALHAFSQIECRIAFVEASMRLTLSALANSFDKHFAGSVDISQTRFTIGRGGDNDWVLVDGKKIISKRHCIIEKSDGGYRLIDSSTNGTTINGKPVDKNIGHLIKQGDEIELGNYRFSVTQLERSSRDDAHLADSNNPLKPKITSILHDVASAGVGGNSLLPGDEGDIFSGRIGNKNAGQLAMSASIGWNGPPPNDAEVVKPVSSLPANREFANKMEQSPVNRMVIDMPKATVIIPENWLQEDPAKAFQTDETVDEIGPAQSRKMPDVIPFDVGTFQIVPVENIDLEMPVVNSVIEPAFTAPLASKPSVDFSDTRSSAPQQQDHEAVLDIVQSFCRGLGIAQNELQQVNLPRFFQNVGKALALSADGLQNMHIVKNKSLSRLDVSGGRAGQTPWIFSIAGEDREKTVHNLVQFLTEAESVDLDFMRRDYLDIEDVMETLSVSVINFIEKMQDNLSENQLERNISSASKALSSLRKAALWEAYVEKSGFYDKATKQKLKANILPLFLAELSKQKKR
jgi:type VI secretion system protein